MSEVADEVETDDEELRAADGRVPGRRGRATRQRLLEQTADMLTAGSYRDLKVVDIARGAGTSPATFYQYFADVEAAVLVLAEDLSSEGVALSDLVRGANWKGKAAWESSLALVDGFLDFWERNRPVLRVMDLATAEGDQRFRRIRVRTLSEITNALTEVLEAQRRSGKAPADLDPMATAGVIVAMLASVASHRWGFEFWGIRRDDTRRSMARMIYTSITNQKPPADA